MTVRDILQLLLEQDIDSEIKFLCECSNESLKELDIWAGEEISTYATVEDIEQDNSLPFAEEDRVIVKLRISL